MAIDRRPPLTVVAGTDAPAEALAEPAEADEIVYTLDTLPRSFFWTWEQLAERLAPHEAEILAAESRAKHPDRRPSRRARRSRGRTRV